MRAAFVALLILTGGSGTAATSANPYHQVTLRVEPVQQVTAIVIRSGEVVRSVDVKGGKALVPVDLPLPWVIGQTRFEPTVYTQSDLDRRRPLALRELGVLAGTLARPPRQGETFTWLLQRSDSDAVHEVEFKPRPDGGFAVRLSAGLYQGALHGRSSATRIRSGIILEPGETTNLGAVICEATASIALRVTNGSGSAPVSGARVVWDPPGVVLNSALSRALHARRWSAVTDSRGMAVVPSVGPLPLSVRWRVEANGFAPGRSTQLQLKGQQRFALPDIRLRPEALIVVRVRLPRDDDAFDNASLTIGEMQDERRRRFTGLARADLREGETTFRLRTYGRKRVAIEDPSGRKICYADFDVVAEKTVVELQPQRIEIHGRVLQDDKPVAKVLVRLDDPADTSLLLAQVATADDGDYRLRTYQSGSLRLYTVGTGGRGKQLGQVFKTVEVGGDVDYRLDFDLPTSGFTLVVVDARAGSPVEAEVQTKIDLGSGRTWMGTVETDKQGRLELTAYPDGSARLTIQAKGYRARSVVVPMLEDAPETIVRLEPSPGIRGRVVDIHGVPIAHARVTGGYDSEMEMQAHFFTQTAGDGRFTLDAAPEPGTVFYIAAARHALGITTLQPDHENVIMLHSPSAGVVTLLPDNAPPSKVYMVMAAPAGGELIPLGALDDLAEVNGMNPYQLQGSALDGSVVLPEFLAPGNYQLFIALRGGTPYIYHRVGAINAPIGRNVALAYKSR